MHKRILKLTQRIISAAVSLIMMSQVCAYAAVSPEYTARVKEVSSHTYTIAEGVKYTKSVLSDSKFGYQRTYKIEYTPGFSSDIVFTVGDRLYSAKSMQTLLESASNDERTAVGGINADFFNMSTGVPVSAFISDGILCTTDLNNMCFAIDNSGNAFFDKPKIQISMKRGDTDYQVIIMNKEFVNYSMCLYTDIYSTETKIKDASTELVMYAFSKSVSYEDIALEALDADKVPEDFYVTVASDAEAQGTFTDNTQNYENQAVINDKYLAEIKSYAESNGYTEIGGKFYIIQTAAPKMGQSQNAVVTEVRINTAESGVHSIPKGAYVLASDNRAYGNLLAGFEVGQEVCFSFSGNEKFYDVKQAIGTGCIIVKDGVYLENNDVYHYKTANPRSAVGITADGRIILFAVDGRQSGVSAGMRLEDLAYEMIKAGCTYAANLDGGGSTTVKAYLAFDSKPVTVNKPSETSERRVANAIVVTNNTKPTGNAAYSYFNRGAEYVLSDSAAPLGYTYYTDENHYYVDPTNVTVADFTYDAGDKGSVSEGYYYPEGYVGKAEIYSINKNGFSNEATSIVSTDVVDSIYVTGAKNEIYVGEVIDLDAGAKRYSFDVYCEDESFKWSVDPAYGFVFENGLFFSTAAADEVVITASYGEVSGEYKVKVKEPPFADISGHWSSEEVCRLYDAGVVVGEMTELGRMFFPNRSYTRNEFCTMLARIMGLTNPSDAVIERAQTEFEDEVLIPDWAYNSVYELYDRGLLFDFAHAGMMFDGNMPVTRREVISVIGRLCPAASEDYKVELTDVSEQTPGYEYIKNALCAGIFQGYEDGTLRVDQSLTRAEGAAVFVRLSDFLGK